MPPKFAVILPAAGRSTRFGGGQKKPFTLLDGRPVWLRAAEMFADRPDVSQLIVVVSADDEAMFRDRFAGHLHFMEGRIAVGGAERFDSIANAIKLLDPAIEFVAVHDAVRPCVSKSQIDEVFAEAVSSGAAILAVPVADTLKRSTAEFVIEATVPRAGLWRAQTPQAFRRDWLEAAYAKLPALGRPVTDDAELVEAAGFAVKLVAGSDLNLKITTREDLVLAGWILRARAGKGKHE